MTPKTCFMCRKRPVKPLTAERDNQVYVNAQSVLMFCSIRCAANHGLLWGNPDIQQHSHFCRATGEWADIPECDCKKCRE